MLSNKYTESYKYVHIMNIICSYLYVVVYWEYTRTSADKTLKPRTLSTNCNPITNARKPLRVTTRPRMQCFHILTIIYFTYM